MCHVAISIFCGHVHVHVVCLIQLNKRIHIAAYLYVLRIFNYDFYGFCLFNINFGGESLRGCNLRI